MFTGLVTAVGVLRERVPRDGGVDLVVAAPWPDVVDGESIAVAGACLTVTAHGEGWFAVHVVETTLGRTTFHERPVGAPLNLERALRVGDRLGGHWVQGHVDGVGTVVGVSVRNELRLLDVAVPVAVAAVTIPLGSITVEGVSLTANAIPRSGVVQLAIVPFTLQQTTLGGLAPPDRVHLEGDLVGKHVRAMAAEWRRSGESS
jgi:riboflavin synthase